MAYNHIENFRLKGTTESLGVNRLVCRNPDLILETVLGLVETKCLESAWSDHWKGSGLPKNLN